MKEYIEKAAVKDEILSWAVCINHPELLSKEDTMHCIDNIPSANVAEVRRGRWLTTDAYPHHLYCSVCYKTYAKNAKWVNELDLPTNYCPNCGARMGKEDEHEAG